MIIPIRTNVRLRQAPIGNYVLVIANVLIFILTDGIGGSVGQELKSWFTLDAARPLLAHYFTYQFLHGDIMHLLGNMLFLWIFGNAVCDRMGSVCYVVFYLAGGVVAGVVFTMTADNPILGASGSIAAVTTAFLVLFPRVHVELLVLFIVITTFSLPAMLLIVFKIILWDNILAPSLDSTAYSNVAYSAHLGGYLFGFLAVMLLLLIQALPRNQFDMLALWSRWRRRSGLPGPMDFRGGATGPPYARSVQVEELSSRPIEPLELSPAERLRNEITEKYADGRLAEAAADFERLLDLDPQHVLARSYQLELANYFMQQRAYERAAQAYRGFLGAYANAPDAPQVRLLLGLVLIRYLDEPAAAVEQLQSAIDELTDENARALAEQELRHALGQRGG